MSQEHDAEQIPSTGRTSYGKAFLLGLGLLFAAGVVIAALDLHLTRSGVTYKACGVVGLFGVWLMCAALRGAWRARA